MYPLLSFRFVLQHFVTLYLKENHIEVTTIKTADNLIIELNNHSKTILDKYKDVVFEHDKTLPVISNQRMNDYLKELGELAEINEPVRETYYKGNQRIDEVTPKYALLGTHAGRRTFICNALSLGIPPQVVTAIVRNNEYEIIITDTWAANIGVRNTGVIGFIFEIKNHTKAVGTTTKSIPFHPIRMKSNHTMDKNNKR